MWVHIHTYPHTHAVTHTQSEHTHTYPTIRGTSRQTGTHTDTDPEWHAQKHHQRRSTPYGLLTPTLSPSVDGVMREAQGHVGWGADCGTGTEDGVWLVVCARTGEYEYP